MKNKNLSMKISVLFAAVLLIITSVETFAARDRTRRIRFESGRTTKVIKDAVVRGDRDRYILHARAGQTLIVHITSVENNAVFDIYRPGGKRTLEFAFGDHVGAGANPSQGCDHGLVGICLHRVADKRAHARERVGEHAVMPFYGRGRVAIEGRADLLGDGGEIHRLVVERAVAIDEVMHLVSRFRSSPEYAARALANFGIEGH